MPKSKSPKRVTSPAAKKALQKAAPIPRELINLEDATPILNFLDNFQRLVDERAQLPSKLISIKIPEPLLAAFRFKAQSHGVPYQTMIKQLMQKWLSEA